MTTRHINFTNICLLVLMVFVIASTPHAVRADWNGGCVETDPSCPEPATSIYGAQCAADGGSFSTFWTPGGCEGPTCWEGGMSWWCTVPAYSQASYYAQSYYQGYYQASYYSQGYYQASYYSQGYYQGYYQASYYSQAAYYSQGFYAPSQPDLVVTTNVSPTTATAGTARTFTQSISNQGTASTGASFTSLLQKANDALGNGSVDATTATVSAIANGASGTASFSYTFPVGDGGTTKYLRSCADKNSAAGTGTITESNEGNNCGPWVGVTVAAPAPAPVLASFSASPTTVSSGGSSTLSWSSTNATSCWGAGFSTGGAPSGSVSTGPLVATTTYSASCTGPGGTTATSSVTVNVSAAALPDLAPNPETVLSVPTSATAGVAVNVGLAVINKGTASTGVSFTSLMQKATSCVGQVCSGITDERTRSAGPYAAGQSTALTFSSYIFPAGDGGTTRYIRICLDKNSAVGTGTITESNESNNCSQWRPVTVAAGAAPPVISTFSASPTSVSSGGSSTLSWTTSGATSCTGTNFSTGGLMSGSVSTGALVATTTYGLSCSNAAGTTTAPSVTVNVTPLPTIANFSASPTTVSSGGSSMLDWSSTNATSCTGSGFSTGGSTSGSVSTGPLVATTTYSASCSGPGGTTATSSVTVGVSSAPMPDLAPNPPATATILQSFATAGTARTFQLPIINQGNATTTGSFISLLQKATSCAGQTCSGITDASTRTTSTILGPNGTMNWAISYAFPLADGGTTQYLRACLDKNSAAGTGTMTESNESNNCSLWKAIAVSAPAATLTPDASTITEGQSVAFTAGGGNGTYTWSPSGGSCTGGSGSTNTCTYAAAGLYTMQVTSITSDVSSVTVLPSAPLCGDSDPVSITSTPSRVVSGNTVTLSWTATDASAACTVTGPGVSQTTSAPSGCSISGSVTTPPITTQSTYTLSCPGGQGDEIIVNVIPTFEEF